MAKKVENPLFLTEADQYVFAQGSHYEIYDKLGAHKTNVFGDDGVYFAVWAPHAKAVSVAGSFNDWNVDEYPMERLGEGGIYARFIPGVKENDMYKFVITTADDRIIYKADPFGNMMELRPGTASLVTDLTRFKWTDDEWQNAKKTTDWQKQPVAIYECHIGSWMRHPKPEAEGFYNYKEFADRIVDYLKKLKYTHVELMGIAEHPFDGSWGYQVTGYYAPTSRYGTPEDFMYLVNKLHKNGIGVILDWVPAHFPRDEFGLADFDGQPLYEHPDPRRGEHPDWGTKIFNYAKNEVRNFLIANAMFWVKKFHIDGLRVDAVASMLYLDYGKRDGEWLPNEYGNNKNLDAIEFFRHLNSQMRERFPGTLMIAEESTAWPMVTGDVKEGGLGFSMKWNMGWMHDFCEYMKLDPYFRKDNHYKMTFAMSYNSSENYILPLSHDEVVHLKCSMLNKMPGFFVDKFANLRVGYTFMFTHCGKKLLFMGQEFGQEHEWNEATELEWGTLEDPLHSSMQNYVAKLLEIYRKYPCMYENDNNWNGFEWMNADDSQNSIYSFVRKSENGKNNLLVVLNMTPMERTDFKLGVPSSKKYKLILNSDATEFGGNGHEIKKDLTPVKEEYEVNGQKYSVTFDLPPYGAAIFSFNY
ncbi:MAG: 1,4-alpha-glucan branching protein GlgB [Lachnospiraceae bacterium]|nr:1,4-alpha-glucan branching protein GlgB [Lachnospiraceae bacterium]